MPDVLGRLSGRRHGPGQDGDGGWSEAASGKFVRLREIAEVAASRQEKMLVFTQFREVTGPLAPFLGSVFGRSGLVLHGATPSNSAAP